MTHEIKHFISVSGGKDSAATAALCAESGIVGEHIFADTGHEHPLTIEHLDYLETQFGPIRRVKADFTARMVTRRANLQKFWEKDGIPQDRIDHAKKLMVPSGNPMLDLAMLKGRFPSTMARFCTQELKVMPIIDQCYGPELRKGNIVVSWQGVRADESAGRRHLPRASIDDPGIITMRPIIKWNAPTVFNYLAACGIEPNPLYKNGMSRVGCMPCIMARKSELKAIAIRYPEHFDRLAEWEGLVQQVSKRGKATFFAADKTPGTEDTRSNAKAVRFWATTKLGGKDVDADIDFADVMSCSSVYGLCE